MSENQIINGIQNAIEQIREGSGYTSIVLPEYFQTIEGEIGRLVQEFIVEEKHLNPGHSLQGGFIAYLVDACGAYVVSTIPKINYGVSVDINISYLASAKLGDKVTVESRVDKIGRSVAFTSIEISRVDENDKKVVIALGRHTLFMKNNDTNKISRTYIELNVC